MRETLGTAGARSPLVVEVDPVFALPVRDLLALPAQASGHRQARRHAPLVLQVRRVSSDRRLAEDLRDGVALQVRQIAVHVKDSARHVFPLEVDVGHSRAASRGAAVDRGGVGWVGLARPDLQSGGSRATRGRGGFAPFVRSSHRRSLSKRQKTSARKPNLAEKFCPGARSGKRFLLGRCRRQKKLANQIMILPAGPRGISVWHSRRSRRRSRREA